MHQRTISVVGVEVTITPMLREIFSDMQGESLDGPQFSRKEQMEMFSACQDVDLLQTEENILELIHFLTTNGVKVPDIIGHARRFSPRTKKFAIRLIVEANRERRRLEVRKVNFLQPTFA